MGANQFTPLAVVSRTEKHWPAVPVAAMFTLYPLGLLPGGPAANRYGRRRVVRPAPALSAAAGILPAGATVSRAAVYVSRPGTGIAAGFVLTAGTVWLRELSATARPNAGARRATYATGGGFASGAPTAGALAEWLPRRAVLPCRRAWRRWGC